DNVATCTSTAGFEYLNEIIEFPVILIESQSGSVISKFHRYVRPRVNPMLTEFCTNLTGIKQEMVDTAKPFLEVLEEFETWLVEMGLAEISTNRFCFVTDGPWDIRDFIRKQLAITQTPRPFYFESFTDLRKYWKRTLRLNLDSMLSYYNLSFEGRLHCGLDDTINLGRIITKLI
ncbi:ribonuclease H-like domain-containing protein, partial [Paraphysoderma sedebokerense]